jgi:hypothetical protein
VPTIFLDRNVVYHSTVSVRTTHSRLRRGGRGPTTRSAFEFETRTTCRVRAAIQRARPKARLSREAVETRATGARSFLKSHAQ